MTNCNSTRQSLLIAKTNRMPLIALVLCAAIAPSQAQAQSEQASQENGTEARDGDIVVTALRRETTLLETPAAISAFDGDALAETGSTSIRDFAARTPSLRLVDNGPGRNRISIRGIVSAGEATVGTYLDDIPIPGSLGPASDPGGRSPDLKLFDIERVEVLRGPQGTLYGSGAMTGAIRFINKKPSMDFEGRVEANAQTTRHGEESYGVQGMVNVPLVDDLIAARLVMYKQDVGGYVDYPLLGRNNVNGADSYGGRLLVRVTPTPNLTLDAGVYVQRMDSANSIYTPVLGRFVSESRLLQPFSDDVDMYSGTLNWDAGGVTATAISSYVDRRSYYTFDDTVYLESLKSPFGCMWIRQQFARACTAPELSDFSAYVDTFLPSLVAQPMTTKSFINEFRLSSQNSGKFTWTAGVYRETRKDGLVSKDISVDPLSGEAYFPERIPTSRSVSQKYVQTAFFGEATFSPSEQLDLTVGARRYSYKKRITGQVTIPWDLLAAVATPATTFRTSEKGWVLKGNISYKPTDGTMLYVQASQGFRPGGANQVLGLASALTPYRADSLWTYELGAKTQLLDRKVDLSLAVFQTDWDDMQVTGVPASGGFFRFLSNAGAARIRGLEGELNARIGDNLTVSTNASYIDAKLTEDQLNANVRAAGRKGDRIPYIPRLSGSLNTEYRVPVSDSATVAWISNLSYQGSSWSEFPRTSATNARLPAYWMLNTRLNLDVGEDEWRFSVFVNNVFDVTGLTYLAATDDSYAGPSGTASTPRTVGISVSRSF